MFLKNEDTLNNHDYFNVITNVYPKLKKYISKIINSCLWLHSMFKAMFL